VAGAFSAYLDGKIAAAELTRQLQRVAPQGTTEGSLFVPGNYLSIPLMQ
jgi:U32 family peptidase